MLVPPLKILGGDQTSMIDAYGHIISPKFRAEEMFVLAPIDDGV